MTYFSDREQRNNKCKLSSQISVIVWNAIATCVNKLICNNNLAKDFPRQCPDGNGICGTDEHSFYTNSKAIVQTLECLPNYGAIETSSLSLLERDPFENEYEFIRRTEQFTYDVLDFIEFVFKHISDVENAHYHEHFKHYELKFLTTTTASKQFITDINEIFYRNNIAFELTIDGKIERAIDKELYNLITTDTQPIDITLNNILKEATNKIKSPLIDERKIALERLWDAFERIKTFNNPKNKKDSATKLTQTASVDNQNIKELLDNECKCLTDIGNKFQIRHFELDTAPIDNSDHIDYLFFRMYTLVLLFLKYHTYENT